MRMFILSMLVFNVFVLDAYGKEEPQQSLNHVMMRLVKAMKSLGDGIFYEDFNLIKKSAHKIANHPKPKKQIQAIAKALGARMVDFKKFDHVVHKSAHEIEALVEKKDIREIVKKYTLIMNNCVSCHQNFREKIIKLFPK